MARKWVTMKRTPTAAFVALALAAAASTALAQEASDHDLETNLEMKLRGNALLVNVSVRGTVRDKKVRLEGTVRTLAQAWEAWEIASKLRGVLEIDDAVVVGDAGKSDVSLRAEVERRLGNILRLTASPVGVTASGGTITLSGTLKDARLRFDAKTAAAGIEGVRAIVDDFRTEPVEDDKIQAGVDELFGRRALHKIPGTIVGKVAAGVVTLEGTVPRLYDRWQAERAVQGINGVVRVDNRLTLRTGSRIEVIDPNP